MQYIHCCCSDIRLFCMMIIYCKRLVSLTEIQSFSKMYLINVLRFDVHKTIIRVIFGAKKK